MLSLNIQNDIVYFKDIKPEHLPKILDWYNKVDDFKFATGIDKAITLDALIRKYAEVAICSEEFFAGIFLKEEEKMIGIIKGRLDHENKNSVWISSIVIDPAYQNKGYGKSAVNLLLRKLEQSCKIESAFLSVIEENTQGRRFWASQNFKEMRRIENHIKLQDKQQNIIIMCKNYK
jgi:ribosomal protein S18 acetylase RimI-like enzyme